MDHYLGLLRRIRAERDEQPMRAEMRARLFRRPLHGPERLQLPAGMASRGGRLHARLFVSVPGERLLLLPRSVHVQVGLRRDRRSMQTDLSRRMRARAMRGAARLHLQAGIRSE